MSRLVLFLLVVVCAFMVGYRVAEMNCPCSNMSDIRTMRAVYPPSIPQQIIDESILQGIDPSLPLAVAWRESRFQQYAYNGSSWGIFQLSNHTVKVLRVAHPFNVRQNVISGVGLLSLYLDQFHGNKQMALCAYAHGPERCR